MTRAQMRDRLQNLLGEAQGTPGGDNPFALDDLLSEEADTLARATYCWHTQIDSEIAIGLAEFCAPQIFRITSVAATDSDGRLHQLGECRPQDLDRAYGARWRDPGSWETGAPLHYMEISLNEVQIYPVPDYTSTVALYTDLATTAAPSVVTSAARPFVAADVNTYIDVTSGTGWTVDRYRIVSVAAGAATLDAAPSAASITSGSATLTQGGLSIRGYACPGDSWPGDDDDCPLVDRAHMTCVYGAAINRMMMFPSQDNIARMNALQMTYRELRGKLGREAATVSRSGRDKARIY